MPGRELGYSIFVVQNICLLVSSVCMVSVHFDLRNFTCENRNHIVSPEAMHEGILWCMLRYSFG